MRKGLFDYLDYKKAVTTDKKDGVKIEVSEIYADAVQKLIARILEREGFEDLKQECRNNMFFIHYERFQILQVEFIGCTKRHTTIKQGGNPIFRITLTGFTERDKFMKIWLKIQHNTISKYCIENMVKTVTEFKGLDYNARNKKKRYEILIELLGTVELYLKDNCYIEGLKK